MRLALAIATALLLSGCYIDDFDYQADFHYHYDFQPGGRLEIDNPNGSVEIEGWDRSTVDISGVKFAPSEHLLDALHIDIRHSPDSISIRTIQPSFHRGGARYTVRVPRQTVLDRVSTANGPILVRNLDSGQRAETMHLRTANGAIEAENIHATVDAQTSNGRIELTDIGGGATMRTWNGRIEATRIGGACEAHTSNGPVTISLDHPGDSPVKVTTSNGSIDLTFREKPRDSIRVEASNGSITLRLPEDTGAHLRADTVHAPITTDFDVYEHLRGNPRSNNHLDGTLGSGGPEIQLSTWNGHISVLKTL